MSFNRERETGGLDSKEKWRRRPNGKGENEKGRKIKEILYLISRMKIGGKTGNEGVFEDTKREMMNCIEPITRRTFADFADRFDEPLFEERLDALVANQAAIQPWTKLLRDKLTECLGKMPLELSHLAAECHRSIYSILVDEENLQKEPEYQQTLDLFPQRSKVENYNQSEAIHFLSETGERLNSVRGICSVCYGNGGIDRRLSSKSFGVIYSRSIIALFDGFTDKIKNKYYYHKSKKPNSVSFRSLSSLQTRKMPWLVSRMKKSSSF